MTSPNLVIVRAGENSHHKTWGTSKNWDLLVSYYGTDPTKYQGDGFERIDGPGGKLGDLHNLWTKRPDLFVGREYIWTVDDDIEATTENIDKLFATMREFNLQSAQPSISLDSFVNHRITAQHEGFKLRYSTMVETMMPCWSRDLLSRLIPLLSGIRYGWGIDHVWNRYVLPKEAAILDCVSAKHCRAQGTGELYVHELDPIVEMERGLSKFKLTQVPEPREVGAVLLDGTYIEGVELTKALKKPVGKVLNSMIDKIRKNPSHTELLPRHMKLT